MEGLVDYVKRQVKCPECRAEHRIPYNGIQGFPTNYTLTKFLELHAEITGTVCLSTYLGNIHVFRNPLLAESFYNVKYGSSVITSKVSPSKNPRLPHKLHFNEIS